MTRASNGGIMVKNRDCGARLLGFCQRPLCDLGVPLQVTEPFWFLHFLFHKWRFYLIGLWDDSRVSGMVGSAVLLLWSSLQSSSEWIQALRLLLSPPSLPLLQVQNSWPIHSFIHLVTLQMSLKHILCVYDILWGYRGGPEFTGHSLLFFPVSVFMKPLSLILLPRPLHNFLCFFLYLNSPLWWAPGWSEDLF